MTIITTDAEKLLGAYDAPIRSDTARKSQG